MEKVLARLLNFLKYVLLIVSFVLVFYGIIITYRRLEKSLIESLSVFIPFGLIFIVYVVNLFIKNNSIRNNLFYNFTSVLVFIDIIIVCLRSQFDQSMVMYQKYGVSYNPMFLADNLSLIEILLYVLAVSNIIIMIAGVLNKDTKINKDEQINEVDLEKKESIINDKVLEEAIIDEEEQLL